MIPMPRGPSAVSALFTVFAIVAICSLESAQDSSALANEDVIKLVKAGLPSAVILAKISSSSTDFDTSVDALLALSAEGIPPDVLTAMAEAGKQAPAPSPSPVAPAPPAASAQTGTATIRQSASVAANVQTNFVGARCEEPGIYLDDGGTLKLIEPTTPGQSPFSNGKKGKCDLKPACQALKIGDTERALELSIANVETCTNDPKVKEKQVSNASYNSGWSHAPRAREEC